MHCQGGALLRRSLFTSPAPHPSHATHPPALPTCSPQAVADKAGQRAARERFQAIRTAYDVLRDPERRRAYDRGEAVDM